MRKLTLDPTPSARPGKDLHPTRGGAHRVLEELARHPRVLGVVVGQRVVERELRARAAPVSPQPNTEPPLPLWTASNLCIFLNARAFARSVLRAFAVALLGQCRRMLSQVRHQRASRSCSTATAHCTSPGCQQEAPSSIGSLGTPLSDRFSFCDAAKPHHAGARQRGRGRAGARQRRAAR